MERKTERNIFQSEIAERPIRKSVQFNAHLIIGDKRYDGYIINISNRGVGMYVVTKFSEGTVDCASGSILKLETRSPYGELLSLRCRIKWLRIQKYSSNCLTTSIGMEVIDPPSSFLDLFHKIL